MATEITKRRWGLDEWVAVVTLLGGATALGYLALSMGGILPVYGEEPSPRAPTALNVASVLFLIMAGGVAWIGIRLKQNSALWIFAMFLLIVGAITAYVKAMGGLYAGEQMSAAIETIEMLHDERRADAIAFTVASALVEPRLRDYRSEGDGGTRFSVFGTKIEQSSDFVAFDVPPNDCSLVMEAMTRIERMTGRRLKVSLGGVDAVTLPPTAGDGRAEHPACEGTDSRVHTFSDGSTWLELRVSKGVAPA